MDFGKTLRKLQDQRGVKSVELARRLGVPKQMVSYFSSKEDVKISTLFEYCDALGVSYQTFMREGVKDAASKE
jgi:transcriptional regulator with XRE-family HTH domain